LKYVTKEYKTIESVSGPLILLAKTSGLSYGELCKIMLSSGEIKNGQVLKIDGDKAVIQVLEGTEGIDTKRTSVQPLGRVPNIGVSEEMLGRVLNGMGEAIDGNGPVISEKYLDINGLVINPQQRDKPDDFIETGISSIDLLNTLVRGQKLPVFSMSGLPANDLALQIVRQSKIKSGESFSVVFGAIGITHREAEFFRKGLLEAGVMERTVSLINLASDPAIERLFTPRIALTIAEYLAFEKGYQVMVVLTDITAYAEALREIGSAREEIPGRRSFPGYMYTDLAGLYERAGRIKGKSGSVTVLPILTMPEDDITHPVPDLTGYITEGQVVLSRELHHQGIYPPIDVLPSLSRLMNMGIGEGKTVPGHRAYSDQLYSSYARGREVRRLVSIVGLEGLTDIDRKYLHFADIFEEQFVGHGNSARSIGDTFEKAREILETLPDSELVRLKQQG